MKLSFMFLELLAGFLFLGVNTNSEEIRGVPGVDYPTFFEIPVTSFRCSDQKYVPGFYADPETGCQVFHYCYNNRQESYLCPTGTIFNQAILACDYWYSSDCVGAASLYNVNNYYQSRALNDDLGDDSTSGDFGTDATITSEPATSYVQHDALDVMPNEDEHKLNQEISGPESYFPEKYPREAEDKLEQNIAVKNSLNQGNTKYAEDHELRSRFQNITEYSDQEALVDGTVKGIDGYDRYPQFVASSGPVSQPLINSSESVYEKLAELYNTNSRLPKNENYRDFTEQELRSLIEEIRDYEHERHSKRDKNYMFRPYVPKEDTEDHFSGLSDSEFNSKLMENSRNDEESKLNSEDESKKLMPEVEWDYDYSEAEEDRLSYLHNLRIQELQASYPSNSNQDDPERNFNEESNQQSELLNTSTNEELLQAPDDMELFSKRLSVTERNKNKLSRRDPIYVVPEMANEAPKLPPMRKRPRGYPFGIQKATDVENPTVSEVNVENVTSNGLAGENDADLKKMSVDTDPETLLNIDPAVDMHTGHTQTVYSNQTVPSQSDYSSETEYNKEVNIPPGNVYTASADFDDLESGDFQQQNSYIFSGNEYDPNAFHNSEQNEWSYTDYAQTDFENEENTERSRVDYIRVEERLPSDEEYDDPFETNAEHIPESAQGEYFSNIARENFGEESFRTLDYTNTLDQLNKRQRNVYYPEVNSENEDTYTDSELAYEKEFQENAPIYASDSYPNGNINGYSGNGKYLGSYEDTYAGEISDVDFENTLDQNGDGMTAGLDSDFSTSEESEENSLQAEKDQSEDSEILPQNNFRNNPQNVYMDPEGNLFYYYIESEMTQSPQNIYGVTPNDAESYLQDTNDSSNTDTVNSGLLSENSLVYGQDSGSNILEDEPDNILGEAYAKNIMKMPDSDFEELLNSPEFSEITEASNIQSNDGDFGAKSSLLVPDVSTEEQNEYNESLNEDFVQEENIEPEESANISSLKHYEYGNYPQHIYRDPEGNMFYYIDSEVPQNPENIDAVPPNSFQLQVESSKFSNVSVADPGLQFENAAEGQNFDSNNEGETEALGEAYAQNIMKMSDAEFKEYVNSPEFSEVSDSPDSQYNEDPDRFGSPDSYTDINRDLLSEGPNELESLNEDVSENGIEISPSEENLPEEYGDFVSRNIYTDSEGNLFYYVNTEMPEDYEGSDSNLNDMASDLLRPGSSWKFTRVDGQNSLLSTPEAGQSDTASEQVYAENIMKMSDAEFKEYLNSQLSEVNEIPDTQYNEKYTKEKRPKFVNQAFTDFEDNIGERLRPPVDELNQDVQKWPNRFELLDPYVGTRGKVLFSDQHIDHGKGFDDDTLQKRAETDFEEGSAQENDFVNPRNIYTDSEGNMFYYDYDQEIPEGDENLEGKIHTVSSDDTFDSDSSEESAFAESQDFASSEQEKDTSLDETYAKNIMEMSDADFKDYLRSQEFTQEPEGLETQFNEDKNIMKNKKERQLLNRFNDVRDNRDEILRPSADAMDENVQSISNRYESNDFGEVKYDKEFPFNEQQNEDDASLNEEDLQQEGYISQDFDELSQEYDDLRSNPQDIYVDPQGNMYYYVVDAEAPADPQDVDSEAESSVESTINSDAAESDFPQENISDSINYSSNTLEENDPASEAFLKNIMKMSDDEFGAYLSSQEFKEVTDVPDIPSHQNKLNGGKKGSDMDSAREINEFESGFESAKETAGASTGDHDFRTLEDTNQIPTNSTNQRVSEAPNSETAVESIDVNKDDQDELYGDFSDLFAVLAKEPGVKGQETKENLKSESAVAQEKDIGIPKEDVKSTDYQSSKSTGNDFNEQMAFKPLVPPSANMAKASEATFIPNNLRPGDEKHFFENPQFPQGINSFQSQRDFGVAPYQQYASPYPSQPLTKKSLPVQPPRIAYKQSQTREPTFGGTLRSMKKSKLQMLGIYANALRQRLF